MLASCQVNHCINTDIFAQTCTGQAAKINFVAARETLTLPTITYIKISSFIQKIMVHVLVYVYITWDTHESAPFLPTDACITIDNTLIAIAYVSHSIPYIDITKESLLHQEVLMKTK